jgi:NADH:ubiquinone oxidoreductase subunit 4 (subunit M)
MNPPYGRVISDWMEKAYIFAMVAVIILFGVRPSILTDMIGPVFGGMG